MLRQHGARDHTCPWYYGNETEVIIEDIIRLRHSMKPYFSAQLVRCSIVLNALNATGRPFNFNPNPNPNPLTTVEHAECDRQTVQL
jgi:hypothetical protein